jgi:hypothetical protein
MSRTFPPHPWALIAVATRKPLAREVAAWPLATHPTSGRDPIGAIDPPVVQWPAACPPRVTTVPTAGSLATALGPMWPRLAVMTRIG